LLSQNCPKKLERSRGGDVLVEEFPHPYKKKAQTSNENDLEEYSIKKELKIINEKALVF